MANLFLDANDLNIHVSNPMKVYGSTGTESVLVDANTTGVVVDQNVERVDLPGAASAFTYQQAGNALKVYSGGTLVATIPLQGDADGTQVVFSNGSVHATLVGGVMTLGGTTVTTTAAAVTPATIDTTITSGSSTGAPATPTFSVAGAASVTEGNTATFTVTLSSAQGTASTVAFALEGTGGAVLGTDTGAAVPGTTGTLTFAPGEVTKTVTVPVTFDSTTETGEGLKVTLSSPSTGTALGTATATTTIADPTAPTFTITSNVTPGASTEEGNTVTYTITPTGVTDKAYTFTLSTIGDTLGGVATAASATDFSPASQTITFAAGSTKALTVVQTIVNDGVTEGLEGYKTSLLDSSYQSVSSVTGTINDPITVPVGTTYTFTTAIDNLTGTNGNDTFIGSDTTVSAADQVAGGTGTDVFKNYVAAGAAVVIPTISGIETIFVSGNNTSDLTVSGYADVTGLVIDTPGALKTYTLGAGDSFTLQNDSAAGKGANVVYSASDTSTAVTFNTVGVPATSTFAPVDLKGSSLATLNLTATGINLVKLNNTAGATIPTTVNVDGAGSIFLDTDTNGMTGITTINAASNTGGVKVDVAASKLTFTGGSGNDEVRFDATEFTADDKLTGGTGTDTIQITDTAVTSITADVVKGINASTGFETLALGAAASSVDADVITSGITNFRDDIAGAQTFTNTTNSTLVEISAGVTVGAADFSISNKLGQTTTNLKMDATSAGASSVVQLKLTGINTINIESDFSGTGSQATANTVTLTAQNENSTFNVTGDHALNLTLLAGATKTGSTVDAHLMTAALTVVGTDMADSIIGGAGKDTITGGAGVDTLTGGAAADKFAFATVDIDTTAGAVTDVITDFVSGTDTIDDTNLGAGSATNYVEATASVSTLTALLSAADTALNGTVLYYVGQVASDSYLVIDTDGNGYTDVIKLTGVDLAHIAYTDIV